MRTGGTIPIVAEMAARGYPVIVGGFGLPEDAIHAPDESYSLHSLEWGEAAARELYARWPRVARAARLDVSRRPSAPATLRRPLLELAAMVRR